MGRPRTPLDSCSDPDSNYAKRIRHIKKIIPVRHIILLLILLIFSFFKVYPESVRVIVAGQLEVAVDKPGSAVSVNYNNSVIINLGNDTRFIKGVELELSAPQHWLSYRGSLAMAMYADLDKHPPKGVTDLNARRIAFEPLPAKIKIVYQIPIRASHGLRSTPYVTVPTGVTPPASFPILFHIMPIIKGLSEELESMVFQIIAKPILSDEGAIRLIPHYPEQLRGKPFTVLIDDVLIHNLNEELLLKEGEHHIVILSDDYRNETRRFKVERTKTIDLNIILQDPTPLIIFEAPQNARVFLDNVPVSRDKGTVPAEPGIHEAKIQVGDYTITKTLEIQRGKTYKVVMAVDIDVIESE